MVKKIVGIVPARFASTRFPGKPLEVLAGKTIIQRTYEQAKIALNDVYVATDDLRIYDHVKAFGGQVVMTSSDHISGTDRIEEAISNLNLECEYVINIQGDEPLIHPDQIKELAEILNGEVEIATQARQIEDPHKISDPNIVKVVINKKGNALYFSRSKIPFARSESYVHYYQHIGIYAYRMDILQKIKALPTSNLEKTEMLEQLRWMDHGFNISVTITNHKTIGIDTPEDLKYAENILSGMQID
ncbi:MAG: 3-deoxy-manno-octulosonate cytidylyltransferase [Cyclobacteriaceae bacterium]|nr:3-deoxy-manno-octulosonate cytidylyltransferase [Cyclobacteriaceae bacterium]